MKNDKPLVPLVLTLPQVQQLLVCSRSHVYDLLAAKRLRAFKDGKRVVFRREEVERYLGSLAVANIAPQAPRRRR